MSRLGLTYVIADLHGRDDLLSSAISRILAHSDGAPARVVTLGDYVDRGPNSRGVIERLMRWSIDHLNLIALKGNHEAMMWEACCHFAEPDRWLRYGGNRTLTSYGQSSLPAFGQAPAILREHLDWISRLPSKYEDEHRIYVHAGVDPKVPLHYQNDEVLLWKVYPPGHKKGYGRRHVVHGHDPKPGGPELTMGRTNLDTLAWKTGRLVVGVFGDSIPGRPIELLEIALES